MASPNSDHGILQSASDFTNFDFDFLICGGGTAGLVLANRLTENESISVGVIEAGANRLGDPVVDTPAAATSTTGNTDYDWHYVSTPQGPNGHCCHLPRGKMLGGSSGINWMVYTRPSIQDFDDWCTLVGDQTWSAAEVKQYQRKHQCLDLIDASSVEDEPIMSLESHHGRDGPIHTSFNPEPLMPIEQAVLKAGNEISGINRLQTSDPWSGNHLGFYRSLGTVARKGKNKGKRSYAASAYLEDILTRPNLKVICEAHVTRVLLDGQRATGAEFEHAGQRCTAYAKREVIVCAGAFGSPHILHLSGIGDSEMLTAAGIECRHNLPAVGQNLHEHPCMVTTYELKPGVQSSDALFDPAVMKAATNTYVQQGSGPLSCITSIQGFIPVQPYLSEADKDKIMTYLADSPVSESSFEKTRRKLLSAQITSPTSAFAQLGLAPITTYPTKPGMVSDQAKFYPTSHPGGDHPHGIGFAINVQYTMARGSLRTISADPYTPPEINPAFLAHEVDLITASAVLDFVQQMMSSEPLKNFVAKQSYPDPEEKDLKTKEGRRQHAEDVWTGTYHPVGTCAMGQVVDAKLRVDGLQSLKVVDASVFPTHVSGNIVSTVYTIAEKAADMIKAEYSL